MYVAVRPVRKRGVLLMQPSTKFLQPPPTPAPNPMLPCIEWAGGKGGGWIWEFG